MNEFAVWDNYEEEFIEDELIAKYSDGIMIIADLDNDVCELLNNENYKDRYQSFDYIQKDDIEGNKIYADSSIVEFDLGLHSNRKRAIGFFSFCYTFKRYQIIVLNSFEINKDALYIYNPFNMGKFKIIDTVQQNKLGLIK